MLICGVDDAGRGSLLGPLVIAGISIKKNQIRKLSNLGVKDSKKLTPVSREKLYPKILEITENHCVIRIYPNTIDRSVRKHKLNLLEAKTMAKVVSTLRSDVSYVDSCDVNPKRFGNLISSLSSNRVIKSYHHADSRFVVVSAASIIAKVNRDKAISRLRKKHNLGSGYPSDSKTINFVSDCIKHKKILPSFVRKSWKPVQIMLN